MGLAKLRRERLLTTRMLFCMYVRL